MAGREISKMHRQMARMAHSGSSEEEIAAKLDLTAAELRTEWTKLTRSMKGVSRGQAINLIVAQLILEARQALTKKHNELALIIGAPEDRAVLTFNMMGIVTGASPNSEKLLGIASANLIGQPIDAFLSNRADGVYQTGNEMERAESGDFVRVIRSHTRPDGTTFEAEHSLVAICGASGYVSGFVREIRDLTNRRIHEVKIDELNATLTLLVHV